jgi:hypothetical protein
MDVGFQKLMKADSDLVGPIERCVLQTCQVLPPFVSSRPASYYLSFPLFRSDELRQTSRNALFIASISLQVCYSLLNFLTFVLSFLRLHTSQIFVVRHLSSPCRIAPPPTFLTIINDLRRATLYYLPRIGRYYNNKVIYIWTEKVHITISQLNWSCWALITKCVIRFSANIYRPYVLLLKHKDCRESNINIIRN